MIVQGKDAVDDNMEKYKYKAKFTVTRFSQREGVDYEDTFAPVVKNTSIKTILSLTSNFE